MRFEPVEKIDKQGRRVLLRSPELSDAPALIDYLKTTSGETPFLLREPDEISMTPELEGKFLQGRLDAERECMTAGGDGEICFDDAYVIRSHKTFLLFADIQFQKIPYVF